MLDVLKIAAQRSTFLRALGCVHRLSVGCSSQGTKAISFIIFEADFFSMRQTARRFFFRNVEIATYLATASEHTNLRLFSTGLLSPSGKMQISPLVSQMEHMEPAKTENLFFLSMWIRFSTSSLKLGTNLLCDTQDGRLPAYRR
jgi:hypothetical protein